MNRITFTIIFCFVSGYFLSSIAQNMVPPNTFMHHRGVSQDSISCQTAPLPPPLRKKRPFKFQQKDFVPEADRMNPQPRWQKYLPFDYSENTFHPSGFATPDIFGSPTDVRLEWTQTYRSEIFPGWDVTTDLIIDQENNVYVTGYTTHLPHGLDFYTIKYDSHGNQLWGIYFDGEAGGDDMPWKIAMDDSGNVYVGGTSAGTKGWFNFTVVKYNQDGALKWVANYENMIRSSDGLPRMVVDGEGRVYLTGSINHEIVTVKFNRQGKVEWEKKYIGPANFTLAEAMEIDHQGNVYIAGEIKKTGTDLEFGLIVLKYNSAGDLIWDTSYTSGDDCCDYPTDIAVDTAGAIYVTGVRILDNDYDYLTLKFDQDGQLQWTNFYDASIVSKTDDLSYALAVDKKSNIYVTGSSQDPLGGWESDIVTIKYNAEGVKQWVRRYGEMTNNSQRGYAVTVDNSGNVYVVGSSEFDETGEDYLVLKYNNQGAEFWAARYSSPNYFRDMPHGFAVNNSGEVFITGSSESETTGYDFATVKFDANGIQQWVSRFNGSDYDQGKATHVVSDQNGNVYVVGEDGKNFVLVKYNHQGESLWSVITGEGELIYRYRKIMAIDSIGNIAVLVAKKSEVSPGNYDYFTVKYSSEGIQQWQVQFNQTSTGEWEMGRPVSIAVGPNGNFYVTGNYKKLAENDHIVTIKYNQNGEEIWKKHFIETTKQYCSPTDLAVDAEGNVYVIATLASDDWKLITIKYSSDGKQQWAVIQDEFHYIIPNLIKTDNWGNIYILYSTIENPFISMPTKIQTYVIKYNPAGIKQWRISPKIESDEIIMNRAIEIDPFGNVFLTTISGNNGAVISEKYNTHGIKQWECRSEEKDRRYLVGNITSDRKGNLYVALTCWGGGANSDIVIVKYLPDGKEQWKLFYSDPRNVDDFANDLAVDQSGNIYIAAMTRGKFWSDFQALKFTQTGEDSLLPPVIAGYELYANIPNPFKKQALIYYELPKESNVSIKIYNCLGQMVIEKKFGYQSKGKHAYYFRADNLSSGSYFYQLKAGDFVRTRKMIVIQ